MERRIMRYYTVALIAAIAFAAGVETQKFEDRANARVVAHAQQLGIEQILPDNPARPSYDTLEEAAVHGAQRLYECSHVYECGGSIAQRPDGKFVVGPVRTDYSGDSVAISHGVPMG